MAFQHCMIFHHSGVFLLSILFVLPALLLTGDSKEMDNPTYLQCLSSARKCLSSCAWQIVDDQETSCQKNKLNALWDVYGNLTERLEDMAKPQDDILKKLQDLDVKLERCQNHPPSNTLAVVVDAVNDLKKKVEDLAPKQNDKNELTVTQRQLIECKQSLHTCGSEAIRLRRLVLERYKEDDLVKAALNNDLDRLQGLLEAGFKVDSRDQSSYSNTVLHGAALGGNLVIIKFLVGKGAPLEAKNTDRNTPFIDATVGRHIPAAQLLFDLGANPLARGILGTARERAEYYKEWDMAEWLKSKGW